MKFSSRLQLLHHPPWVLFLGFISDSKASTSPQLLKSAIGQRTVGSTNQLKSASKQQQIRKFRLEYSRNLSPFPLSSLLIESTNVFFHFLERIECNKVRFAYLMASDIFSYFSWKYTHNVKTKSTLLWK